MSNWNKLNEDEQLLIIDAANRLKGLYMVKDILAVFDKINLPLLYNYPGYYEKFCPDTEAYLEDIEDYCWDKM